MGQRVFVGTEGVSELGISRLYIELILEQKDNYKFSKLLDAFSSHPDFDERIERMRSKANGDGYKCN